MAAGDTARLYHRLTSSRYGPGLEWPDTGRPVPVGDPRLLADFVPLDIARLPAPCKRYPPGLPVVELPRDWPQVPGSAASVLAGRDGAAPADPRSARTRPAAAPVRGGRSGHWSVAIVGGCSVRPARRAAAFRSRSTSRPAASQVYRMACTGTTRSATRSSRSGRQPAGEASTLIVTGVPWRTGWKYAERGLRHVYWDAGTMLAQTLALAGSAGFSPRLWTRFFDAEVTRLVGADGIHEFPLALVGLGHGEPAIRPSGEAAAWRGRCGADRVPARHAHAARGRRRPPWRAMGRLPLPCPIQRPPRTISMP